MGNPRSPPPSPPLYETLDTMLCFICLLLWILFVVVFRAVSDQIARDVEKHHGPFLKMFYANVSELSLHCVILLLLLFVCLFH